MITREWRRSADVDALRTKFLVLQLQCTSSVHSYSCIYIYIYIQRIYEIYIYVDQSKSIRILKNFCTSDNQI